MRGIRVDSNVILDVFQDDATWFEWSASALDRYGDAHTRYINAIVYFEVSLGFKRIQERESALSDAGFEFLRIPMRPCSPRAKPSFDIENFKA